MNHTTRARLHSTFAFLAADKGGDPAPAPAPGNAPKGTLEEQLTKARGDLSAAQGRVTALTTERDTLRSERDTLQGQFNAATQAATTANSERDSARNELATVKGQVTSLTAERDVATSNVTRLESLCGVKGIDHKSAVPATPAPATEKRTVESYNDALSKATTPEARNAILKEFADAAKAGNISRE